MERNAVFGELLESGFDLRVRVTGTSMHPMIADGSFVTITRGAPENLKPGDVLLIRTRSSGMLLHRFVRWTKNGAGRHLIQTKGDALWKMDEAVPPEMIMGKVVAVEKRSKTGVPHIQDMSKTRWRFLWRCVACLSLLQDRLFRLWSHQTLQPLRRRR